MKVENSKYRGKTTSLLVIGVFAVLSVAILFMVYFYDQPISVTSVMAPIEAEQERHFVDNKTCTDCHTEQAQDWLGSYMVRPVLQVLFDRNIKKYCIHISGFLTPQYQVYTHI